MDDDNEKITRKLCCTCLSEDRNLFQLCRVTDGVNNLYWLLSYDMEAYMEGFHKDSANLYVCWECKAVMSRISRFRNQACKAQKQLTIVSVRQSNNAIKALSKLTHTLKAVYDYTFLHSEENSLDVTDNFIDCGSPTEVKIESDTDDIPLSELLNNYISNENDAKEKQTSNGLYLNNTNKTGKIRRRIRKIKIIDKIECMEENHVLEDSGEKYFYTINMSDIEMIESRSMQKLGTFYVDSPYKCDDCIEGFPSENNLKRHNLDMHTKKDDHALCDICRKYIETSSLPAHRSEHYIKYTCAFCDLHTLNINEMLGHLKNSHLINNVLPTVKKKNRSGNIVKNPGSKPRRNRAMKDERTPHGFKCMECDKYFENKKLRWKHVQIYHRDGFECSICGKRFPFRNNLTRHEQTHSASHPRMKCPICSKQVRADLLRVHLRIHGERERFACSPCERTFASRASYEHHLRYARVHAQNDVLKYKCSICDKGYKSKGELRDHINYRHMGKTQHKCPVCAKALATQRCVTRHVKRAHDGIKESERDKICQQCGKAFRDKKGLREHEFTHTGERPLSCEICGCTFRQNATLYTHKKRVHKIYPKRTYVELMEAEAK